MGTPRIIHIFGASGAGTTTLGKTLSAMLGLPHLDTDDFYWVMTEPPYQTVRPPEDRLRLLRETLAVGPISVISGSLCGWGDAFIPHFVLAAWIKTPVAVRIPRLVARERARFGARLDPCGDIAEEHQGFIAWAAEYDTAPPAARSFAMHQAWSGSLPCPVLLLDGERPPEENARRVAERLG